MKIHSHLPTEAHIGIHKPRPPTANLSKKRATGTTGSCVFGIPVVAWAWPRLLRTLRGSPRIPERESLGQLGTWQRGAKGNVAGDLVLWFSRVAGKPLTPDSGALKK